MRSSTQYLRHRAQRFRRMQVITIQPAKDLAGAARKRAIDRIRLSLVAFRNPPGQFGSIPCNDIRTSISAPRIIDEILQRRIPLAEYAENGRLDEGRLLIRGRHDSEPRPLIFRPCWRSEHVRIHGWRFAKRFDP